MTDRLVLLSPGPAAVSETFILAHRHLLPFAVIPLYRWRYPYQSADGGWTAILPGLLRQCSVRLQWPLLARWADGLAARQVASWLRRCQARLVLAEYGPLGANILHACRLAKIPLVVIFHGFDAYQHELLSSYRLAYQHLFASAAALVAVSEPMRQQLIDLGAPADRIDVNPCGVDPVRFNAADPAISPPQFLAIGRFVGKKGPMRTIEAFAQAHQVEPSCRLTMIGTGPLLAECQRRVEEFGLADVITFLGACSHADVQIHLRQARAFVQHSLTCSSGDQEGTPVALIEAQMSGLPVVSTFHAGIPGVVVHGRTGFLVPEGDVAGMADAMVRLAQDPGLASELGAAGRAHALEHHTMERHINALTGTLHAALSRHAAAVTA